MHSFSVFSVLILALVNVSVVSTADRVTTVPPPDRYYLQSKVVSTQPDCGSDKNNLWVYSHHVGAAIAIAGLSSNKSIAWEGTYNNTRQLFTPNTQPPSVWPLAVTWSPYQAFNLAFISIVETNSANLGFYFNENGLQLNSSYGGWLVCDWWHGVPQLFNLNGYSASKQPHPKACSKVNLFPVAVDEAAPIY